MPPICHTTDRDWLLRAAAVIRDGGVVALAFETLFGLAANALDPDVVAKVAAIKSRKERASGERPIAVILPNLAAVSRVTDAFTPLAQSLSKRHWPGALTLIIRAKEGLPRPLMSKKGLIGIRLPGPSPAATLAAHMGIPLTATSANRAGEAEAITHSDITDLDGVDLLVAGTVSGPPGSTVVDATGTSPVVLRAGIISLEEEN